MATIVGYWNGLLGSTEGSSLFVILGQGFPLALQPTFLQRKPSEGFFPHLSVLLSMWHVEFLFAAVTLLQ